MGKKTQKQKAIDCILEAMHEICVNLRGSAEDEAVRVNSIAMLHLSEAYKNIEGTEEENESK